MTPMPDTPLRVHFWSRTPVRDVDTWHPDREPFRYQDGFGHAILELYARLKLMGWPVTLGPTVPDDANLAIAFAKEISPRSYPRLARLREPLVVIMSDHPDDKPLGVKADARVLPYPSANSHDANVWIPLLPQRGLVPRATPELQRLTTVGYFGHIGNAPQWLTSDSFLSALEARDLRLHTAQGPTSSGGAPWTDFRDVDVTMCVRRDDHAYPRSKPPTKLINAWAARTLPIATSEPAARAIARNGHDAMLIDSSSADDALRALDCCLDDRRRFTDMLQHVDAKAVEYSSEAVLGRWAALLATVSAGGSDIGNRIEARNALGRLVYSVKARIRRPPEII